MKWIAHRQFRLAKLVVAVGKENGMAPLFWEWLPPSRGDMVRFRIPVALIQQLLARKQQEPAKPEAAEKRASPRPSVMLPLARVVIPLNGRKAERH